MHKEDVKQNTIGTLCKEFDLKPYNIVDSLLVLIPKTQRELVVEKIHKKYDSAKKWLPQQLKSFNENQFRGLSQKIESYFLRENDNANLTREDKVRVFYPGASAELISVEDVKLMKRADSLLKILGYQKLENHPDGTACYSPKQ